MEGSFGNQLKTLRGRVKHLKQSDVARRLGVSVASVNYWENDLNKPNMRNLKNLIALLFVEGAFTSTEEIALFTNIIKPAPVFFVMDTGKEDF